ncbi:hypothetical protein BDN71DRAFT_1483540 [Pleurotus eryngii]|uniref:CxC2-like cysteine cluster KDZ transposase-associated domain-containing protein n=1 Tax=Pleurotus eryngii TaxID=5323 RepID=A0A9P6DDT8_PLEER|nr:hypothetical protein BDN71DRAFT_1483540 [Pleurotus eryngii]
MSMEGRNLTGDSSGETSGTQIFLDKLLKQNGHLRAIACLRLGCTSKEALYRCRDCFYSGMYCWDCIVVRHLQTPFHRVQIWQNRFFTDNSLQLLNYTISLGHNGVACVGPLDIAKDFVVIDNSGIHVVNLAFCSCYEPDKPHTQHNQLLCHKLFPATLQQPQAAFSFEVLKTFHLLTLQSKVTAYDFYRALEQKTDNVGLKNLPVSMMCVYRDLFAAKHSGRGHDPDGIKATECSQVAVECPTCSHPERNLSQHWASVPVEQWWLYLLILTMDANFRLKNWNQWHAINQANQKHSVGYSSTGIEGVICGHHSLPCLVIVSDTRSRYANMDFLLFQTLVRVTFGRLLLSYDIACQYSRDLFRCMKQMPTTLQLSDNAASCFDFVVPKFHLYGHGMQYCTQSDLEDPERWWAHINPSCPI